MVIALPSKDFLNFTRNSLNINIPNLGSFTLSSPQFLDVSRGVLFQIPKTYLARCQTYKIKPFTKIVNSFQLLTIFRKKGKYGIIRGNTVIAHYYIYSQRLLLMICSVFSAVCRQRFATLHICQDLSSLS